jgi:uncharacterized RDD family membrane protein YckC
VTAEPYQNVSNRRVFAAVIDVAFQIGLMLLPIGVEEICPVHIAVPIPAAITWLLLPVLYSTCAVITSASPAQWMLGLKIVAIQGGRSTLAVRILRACILKGGYILFLVCGIFLFAVSNDSLASYFIAAVALFEFGLLFSFLIAEQVIELDELPYYDRWLKTTVIRSGETGQLSRRGFDVVEQRENQ